MNAYHKGIAPIVLVIIIAAALVGGGLYFAGSRQEAPSVDEAMTEKEGDAMVKDENFEAVIAKAQSITLKDVAQSGASGAAWLAVYEGKTYHRVMAKNLPPLPGNDFYEGWLVKNPVPGGFFSTGKLSYNPQTKEGKLDFVVDGDKSDYRFVVITSEPDDGNPAPDKHIIEERFGASANLFVIALDAMMEKEGDAMMDKEDGAMTGKPKTHVIEMTAAGFTPANLTIKKGDMVQFVNKDARNWWPASAVHPTHAVYSGTSLSEHCSDGANDAFDACQGIAPGASWSFTFDKAGTWGYHDHLRSSVRGTIIVQ